MLRRSVGAPTGLSLKHPARAWADHNLAPTLEAPGQPHTALEMLTKTIRLGVEHCQVMVLCP